MLSPRRIIPPAMTRHNIPRRPRSSRRSPALIFSNKSQGLHTTLTSSCASPMRRRSPTGNPFTLIPRVVMFSRMIPGCRSISSRVSVSMSKTWRGLPVLACAHPASPESCSARISSISTIARRLCGARNRCITLAMSQSPAACTRRASAAMSLRKCIPSKRIFPTASYAVATAASMDSLAEVTPRTRPPVVTIESPFRRVPA